MRIKQKLERQGIDIYLDTPRVRAFIYFFTLGLGGCMTAFFGLAATVGGTMIAIGIRYGSRGNISYDRKIGRARVDRGWRKGFGAQQFSSRISFSGGKRARGIWWEGRRGFSSIHSVLRNNRFRGCGCSVCRRVKQRVEAEAKGVLFF